jgi:probable addiction module antidote protein
MADRSKSYRDSLLESLADPIEAAHYLNAALEDSPEMFLCALRDVAQAHQVTRVAKSAGVTRESLYRAFSAEGNPTLDLLNSALGAMGLKIDRITPIAESVAAVPPAHTPARYGHVGRYKKASHRRSSHDELAEYGQGLLPFADYAAAADPAPTEKQRTLLELVGESLATALIPQTANITLPQDFGFRVMNAGFYQQKAHTLIPLELLADNATTQVRPV